MFGIIFDKKHTNFIQQILSLPKYTLDLQNELTEKYGFKPGLNFNFSLPLDIDHHIIDYCSKNRIDYDRSMIEIRKIYQRETALANIDPEGIVPHASLFINLASNNDKIRSYTLKLLYDEISFCGQIGIKYLNVHPGSNKDDKNKGFEILLQNLEFLLDKFYHSDRNNDVNILIENSVSSLCNNIDDYKYLIQLMQINGFRYKNKIKFCLDTCHLFASGIDMNTHNSIDQFMKDFLSIVGINNFSAIHFNGSKFGLASRRDRHMDFRSGFLNSKEFLEYFMRFKYLPMIVELESDATRKHLDFIYQTLPELLS